MCFFLVGEVHAHKQTQARAYVRNPVTVSHTSPMYDSCGRDEGTGTRYLRNLKVKSPEIFGDRAEALMSETRRRNGKMMKSKDTRMSVGQAAGRFNTGSPRHW